MNFVHLRAKSHYSFLDGVASPAELAQAAAGMPALGLTEFHGLTGAIEFHTACRAAGIQPLFGLEITLAAAPESLEPAASRLAVLALDLRGWGSLCRLSSLLLAGDSPGRLTWAQLAEHSAGLLALSGGRNGAAWPLTLNGQGAAAAAHLAQLADLFPQRLYVELQIHTPEDRVPATQLAHLAEQLQLPLVATHAIHYLTPEQADTQRLLTAIRLNTPLAELPPAAAAPPGAHFLSADEMRARFADWPAALDNTLEIAGRCQFDLPVDQAHFPEIPLPPGQSVLQVLTERAQAGAVRRYGALTPEISARLQHELAVIGERGYAPLFLIVEELLAFARRTGVPHSSRGSAASSLVAHCLDITSPDPLRLNLYFERFLNPARSSPPDIDTDLCSRRRDRVIQHVYDTYGAERVAMVATINRFRARSALRETAKAHGLPAEAITRLVEALPYRGWGPPGREGADDPYAELAEAQPGYSAMLSAAARLLGLPRHLSIHPGGIVVAPGELTDLAPTQYSSKGVVITQFDLDSVARLGLVKIDLLGIRGLTVLGDVAEKNRGALSEARDAHSLELLDAIRADDAATAEMIRTGQTIGCFQIESPGMRATLKEVGAATIDDVMVALALYRPGPLTGGLKDAFVRRHRGQEATVHLHPALAPLLGDTHGVILYQEQVLRLAHHLAGLSLAEADLLRRAMSHFDPGRQMQLLKDKFVAGAQAVSGVPRETGERIWDLMAAFAGYGFPKAHAASYAQVAWKSAWCKAHRPAEFMAAVLANWGGYYSQRVYLTEARRMGLALRPPHINAAQAEFAVVRAAGQPLLVMGLNQVRDLTQRTQARILRERPFRSLADFLARADPRRVEAENLVKVGALEGLGAIPALLRELRGARRQPGQMALFEPDLSAEDDWPLAEQVAAQEELLGASVSAHPLELVAGRIERAGALTTVAAAAQLGQRVRVAGMRQTWRRVSTARGDYIYFMALEDLEGMLDVVISGEVYRKHRAAFAEPGPYVLEGVVEFDAGRGEPAVRAERIWRL